MSHYNARREFLRLMSLGTAAVATGVGFPSYAQALEKTGGRKLGVALLGLGRYATNQLAPALRQTKLCELVGVVTGHPEKSAQWAKDFNLPEKNHDP